MSHAAELQIIQHIHEYRNALFDAFFTGLNYFDRQEFLFILIPTLWLIFGWKTGLRLFYILFLNTLVNLALKQLFLSPRPYHLDPTLAVIKVGGYGFPSGAAQTVVLLSGILIQSWKSPWRWVVAAAYVLLVSFSRVYLGVHFPTDILGGWVVGFALWALYAYGRPPLEQQLEKMTAGQLLIISQAVPLLILFWQSSAISFSGSAMGLGLGIYLNHTFGWTLAFSHKPKTWALRAAIGVIGTFLCYYVLANLPIPNDPIAKLCQFALLGLWIATGSILVCRLSSSACRQP